MAGFADDAAKTFNGPCVGLKRSVGRRRYSTVSADQATEAAETAEAAVLNAIRTLSPHASWDDITRISGVPRHELKTLLDPLEDRGLIKPWHWHDGRAMECISDGYING